MPVQLKSGKRRRYYRCSSVTRHHLRLQIENCGAAVVPADLCELWTWEEVKRYLQNPQLIAREIQRVQAEGIDPQLVQDREAMRKALDRHTQGTQRLVRRLREADDELAVIIERELLQTEREKQAMLKTLSDLDARIDRQEQAVVNLKNLYDYCRDVERELTTFEFAEQRLALEALGVEVIANGREWQLVANIPWDVVETETVS